MLAISLPHRGPPATAGSAPTHGAAPVRQAGCMAPAAAALPAGAVLTDRGAVAGVTVNGVRSFKGVPYAAPPTGPLRWRPPVDADCWEGVRPADAFGPMCPQHDAGGQVAGDEDCLTLNVWTPASDAMTAGRQELGLPVLVFIHGGGNVQGSASLPVYNGHALAARGTGTVVVTLNYRLGALGFLALPSFDAESADGVSGNYGILDQMAALRWVQRNIAAFGGDPARVTIFGESAGGVDVCVLLAAPAAAGLFAGAIMESAGGCSQPSLDLVEARGASVALTLGCPADAPDQAACLRARPFADVVAARPVTISVTSLARLAFSPAVDGHVLPAAPIDAIRAGRHNRVPVIVGANADETAGLAPPPIPDEAAYRLELTRMIGPVGAGLVLRQYPVADYPSARAAYIAVTTDAGFVCPSRRAARALAGAQSEPVFRYFFTHAVPAARAAGAFHGLELAFVFGTLPPERLRPAERDLTGVVMDLWLSFAATGRPALAGEAPAWPVYDAATDPYLRLDLPLQAGAGVRTANCDFWDTLLARLGNLEGDGAARLWRRPGTALQARAAGRGPRLIALRRP